MQDLLYAWNEMTPQGFDRKLDEIVTECKSRDVSCMMLYVNAHQMFDVPYLGGRLFQVRCCYQAPFKPSNTLLVQKHLDMNGDPCSYTNACTSRRYKLVLV